MYQSGRIGCPNSFFLSLRRMGLELESWFLPRFPEHFSPLGFFLAVFFLAPVLTAFALLAVAQLYEIFKNFVRFLVILYFRFILYFLYIVRRS